MDITQFSSVNFTHRPVALLCTDDSGCVAGGNIALILDFGCSQTILNHMVKYSDDALDAVFGALSDPTRRAILLRLTDGEVQVTELARPFGMSLAAVSKHLRVLERAGLIRRRVDGRIHRFHVNPEPLENAQAWIEAHRKFWQQQLDSLGEFLEKSKTKEGKK